MTTTVEKPLPQLYREAADLVLEVGHVTGDMKAVDGSGRCFGFCTMGAVFEAAGIMDDHGLIKIRNFTETPEFLRLALPVAERLNRTGRYERERPVSDRPQAQTDWAYWTIANWNDFRAPTAQVVAAVLRETADAVEKVAF